MIYLKLFEDLDFSSISAEIDSLDIDDQIKETGRLRKFAYKKTREVNKRNKELKDKLIYKKNKDIIDNINNILDNDILRDIEKDFNIRDVDGVEKVKTSYVNKFKKRSINTINDFIKNNDIIDISEKNIKITDNANIINRYLVYEDNLFIHIKIREYFDFEKNELSFFINSYIEYRGKNPEIKKLQKELDEIRYFIHKDEFYNIFKKIKDIITRVMFHQKTSLYNL